MSDRSLSTWVLALRNSLSGQKTCDLRKKKESGAGCRDQSCAAGQGRVDRAAPGRRCWEVVRVTRWRSRAAARRTRRVRAQYCGDKELPLGIKIPKTHNQGKSSHCFPESSDGQEGRPEEMWEEDICGSQVGTPCPCPSYCPIQSKAT